MGWLDFNTVSLVIVKVNGLTGVFNYFNMCVFESAEGCFGSFAVSAYLVKSYNFYFIFF